jgi:hypothetical protein
MEKSSRIGKRLVLCGIALVGLAVGLYVSVEHSPDPAPAPAAPGRRTNPVVSAAPGSTRERAASGLAVARAQDRPASAPSEIIEQILSKDKNLRAFMSYQNTVLLDVPRRDAYRKLLSDPAVMTEIAEALMQPGSGKVEVDEQYHRLMQIDYLEAALNWADNPQRQRALQLTANVIAADSFRGDQGEDRRQMLAGGKMELYRLLYDQDVAKTQQLVASARGTRMETLVNWMSKENLRRLAREEEIRVEMQGLQAKAN